jgi:CheY-like chemotaxis protein
LTLESPLASGGRGTRVWCGSRSAAAARDNAGGRDGGGAVVSERDRILVVDDDPGMRRALQRILAPWYEVETAAGATEALVRLGLPRHTLQRAAPAAAVPAPAAAAGVAAGAGRRAAADGDGYSLCQAIREGRPDTDVILITGSLSQPDEKLYRSLEQGAFYFLFKPFDRRVLLALVERCLRLQRERAGKERFGAGARRRPRARAPLPAEPAAAPGGRRRGLAPGGPAAVVRRLGRRSLPGADRRRRHGVGGDATSSDTASPPPCTPACCVRRSTRRAAAAPSRAR